MKTSMLSILCALGLFNIAGAQTRMKDLHKFLVSNEVTASCAPLYIQQAYRKNAAIGLPAGVLSSLLLGPVASIFLYPTLTMTVGNSYAVAADILEKKKKFKAAHIYNELRIKVNHIDGNIRPVVIMPTVHHLIFTAEAILWAVNVQQENGLSEHHKTVLRYLENKKAIKRCTPDLLDVVRKEGKEIDDESCSEIPIEDTTLAEIKDDMHSAKKVLSRAQTQWLVSWGKLARKDGLTSNSDASSISEFNTKLLGKSLCKNDKVLNQRKITK